MQRSGNNHQQDAPFVGTRHAAISRTKGSIDILTLKWHHGDGQMPPPLNVRLVGASYNMERTGRCYQTDRQTSLAIHVGPDSSIVPHQIPSELLFCHLVAMHTGAGSKRGCDKGVLVPVSARGKRVGSSKTKKYACDAQFSQFPQFTQSSGNSLYSHILRFSARGLTASPNGRITAARGFCDTLPPGFSVVSGCRPESIAPYQGPERTVHLQEPIHPKTPGPWGPESHSILARRGRRFSSQQPLHTPPRRATYTRPRATRH